ncbi:MAG: hypothetical protein ACRDRN_17745 [Sciscionella sp.]
MAQAARAPAADGPLRMSMTDIAELAGVHRPVVTTWRRRHDDFPAPRDDGAARPLFDAREVCEWLIATGRAERERIEPDLCLYTLGALGSTMPPGELVAATTALICLRYLDDEPLVGTAVAELRDRAAEADPADALLHSEIIALPNATERLVTLVDELIEATWGCQEAFELIMDARDRLGVRELSASTVAAELARLIAGLSGVPERAANSGSLLLADPFAGGGDLLTALAREVPESCATMVAAAESEPRLARLLRRRLTVRGVPIADQSIRVGAALPEAADDPDAIVTQLPYRPVEHRDAAEVLAWLDDIGVRLAPDRTAVALGPADVLTGSLPRYSSAERARSALLSSGMVEAVIRLPGGLMPFRPGYQTALWVLTSAHTSPLKGRVLLGDISDHRLTGDVVDALITDVVTWRRGGHRPGAHTRRFCVQVDVAALVDAAGPLVAPRSPSVRQRSTEVPATVARVAELEGALAALADPGETARPQVRTGIVRAAATAPKHVAIGSLIESKRLVLIKGARLAATDVTTDGQHRVLGAPEIAGSERPGGRSMDRAVLAQRYPRAVLTEPGDVVVLASPVPSAYLDQEGFSVVEFPARALRIPPSRRDRLTPRVLAALLPVGGTRRTDRAVRAPRRLEEWEIPVLDPATAAAADALLTRLDERRAIARRELAALDEIHAIAASGLTNGTLTFQP